jgi:hypothetical protein
MPSKNIPVPPFGKIEYLADHERQVLPLLTAAVKEYKSVADMDTHLKEQFADMDAFSKKIPSIEAVKADFLKIDGDVKMEAKLLQSLKSQVTTVRTLLHLLTEEAKEAKKSLVIDDQDMKAASDVERAEALQKQLDIGPLATLADFVSKANGAYFAWDNVEKNPIAMVTNAMAASDVLLKIFGVDTVNQQIASLEKEAGELKLKSVVARFKLAQGRLAAMKNLEGQIAPALKDVSEQYAAAKASLPTDFDDANKKGQFHFNSLIELSKKLADYRTITQNAATAAHEASDNIFKTSGKLGTQWTPNIAQAKDILQKMMTVTKNAMNRAIHERDGADAHIKIVSKQIDELEKMLSKTRLKPS